MTDSNAFPPDPEDSSPTDGPLPTPDPTAPEESFPEPAPPPPDPGSDPGWLVDAGEDPTIADAVPPPPPPPGAGAADADPTMASAPPPPPPPPPFAPPPPPPPAMGGAASPVPVFSATQAIGYGWKAFTKNLGPILILMLAIFAVNVLVNVVSSRSFINDSWVLNTLVSLLSTLISMVIAFGIIKAALAILDGRKPEIGEVFNTDRLVPYIIAAIAVSIITTIGFILLIIPGLIAAFLLQFFGYAIADGKTERPLDALRISFETVKPHWGELLLLAILLFLLNIGGAVLCLVGLLATVPTSIIAVAYAWRWCTRGQITPVA